MKKLPERYYELVLERDQLKEEYEYLLNHKPIDILECVQLSTAIDELNEEIQMLEEEMNKEEPRKFYLITREVYDIENEDFYSFVNEYKSIAEALVEFTVQTVELKELFTEYEEICDEKDYFYIRDASETVTLALHEVVID